MIKNLRGFLKILTKENAVAPSNTNKCRLLIFDEYLNKYVSADELLIPQTKISTTPNTSKISKDFFLFELLLKKFVNPKLDLLIRLPKHGDQSLQGHDCQKKQSFSTFGPRLFWKKNKKSAKKHGIPALPPVHEKINEDKAEPLKLGWAGQVTKKPSTDPRPENSKGGSCPGTGKGPKRNKPEQDKKLMVCKSKGKLSEIDNQLDSDQPFFSKERFPVDDTLPIPQEDIKQPLENVKLETESKKAKKEIKAIRSSEKVRTERKQTDKHKTCSDNKYPDVNQKEETPCKKKIPTNNVESLDTLCEKESKRATGNKQDSTSRYLNKPTKRNIKKVCSKQLLRKRSKSPQDTNTTQRKQYTSKENNISKEKKICWNDPGKDNAVCSKTSMKNILSFSKKSKIHDTSDSNPSNVRLNIQNTQKACSSQKCLEKTNLCSNIEDSSKTKVKESKDQPKFNFMVRPKTTDYKNGTKCSSLNVSSKPGTLKMVSNLNEECPERKPTCQQNMPESNGSSLKTKSRPKSSNFPEGDLKKSACANYENWIKNKTASCNSSSKPSGEIKDKISLIETCKKLDKKCSKIENKICKDQDLEAPKNNRDDRNKLKNPKPKTASDVSLFSKSEPNTIEKLESFSQKKCATKTQSDLKECDHLFGFQVRENMEKDKQTPKKNMISFSGVGKKEECTESAKKSNSVLKKKVTTKSLSNTDCSAQKISSKLIKSKSDSCINDDKNTHNKPDRKSKQKIRRSKTCSGAGDPEISEEKTKCHQNLAEIDEKTKKYETKIKESHNESKPCPESIISGCSKEKVKCEKNHSDGVVHGKKSKKKSRKPETCPDIVDPESVAQKENCAKDEKNYVEKIKDKSTKSQKCLTQNKESGNKGKSKRSKSKLSTKSEKSSLNNKCSKEKGTELKSTKTTNELNISSHKKEDVDTCKTDATQISSKPESKNKKYQSTDDVKQNHSNAEISKSPLNELKIDRKQNEHKKSLNKNEVSSENLSKRVKGQGSQCKKTSQTTSQKPKKIFKHAVVCTKSSNANKIKNTPKTSTKVSSLKEHSKIIGTKNQNEKSKRGKMCSIQPLQKRINENPIKNSKNIQAKSFSQLKTVGSREKSQLVLYLKNYLATKDFGKYCKQNQGDELNLKPLSNESPNQLNIYKPVLKIEESNQMLIKQTNNSVGTKHFENPENNMKNRISLLSKDSQTSINYRKGPSLESKIEDENKNDVTGKSQSVNNNKEIKKYFPQGLISSLTTLNLDKNKTKVSVPKDNFSETSKTKTDVKRFGILSQYKPTIVNKVRIKPDSKGIKEKTCEHNSSSFIAKSLATNMALPLANIPKKTVVSEEKIVNKYLSKFEQENITKLESLKTDQNHTYENLVLPKNKIAGRKYLKLNNKDLGGENFPSLEKLKSVFSNNNLNQTINHSEPEKEALNKHNRNKTVDTIRALVKPLTSQKVVNPDKSLTLLGKYRMITTKSKESNINSKSSPPKVKSADIMLDSKSDHSLHKTEYSPSNSSQKAKIKKIMTGPDYVQAGSSKLKPITPVANSRVPMKPNQYQTPLEEATKMNKLTIEPKKIPAGFKNSNIHNTFEVTKVENVMGRSNSKHNLLALTSPESKLNIPTKLNINKIKTQPKSTVECKVKTFNTPLFENKQINTTKHISYCEKHPTVDIKRQAIKANVKRCETISKNNSLSDKLNIENPPTSIERKETNTVSKRSSKTYLNNQLQNTPLRKENKDEFKKISPNNSQNKNISFENSELKSSFDKHFVNTNIFQGKNDKIAVAGSIEFKGLSTEEAGNKTKSIDRSTSNKEGIVLNDVNKVKPTTHKQFNSTYLSNMYIKRKNNRTIHNNRALKLRSTLKVPHKSKNMFALKKKITVDSFNQENKTTLSKPYFEQSPKESKPFKKSAFQCAIKKPDKMVSLPLEEIQKPLKAEESKNNDGCSIVKRESKEIKSKIIDQQNDGSKINLRNCTLTINNNSFVETNKNEKVISNQLENLVNVVVKKRLSAKILPKPQN